MAERGGTQVPIQMFQTPYNRNKIGQPNPIIGITPEVWFSPLQPLPDYAPPETAGRQWDFPVGYNLQQTPRPLSKISFQLLRETVTKCDIMSVIINNRKDQIESREWTIRPIDAKLAKDKKKTDADPRIKELTEFFQSPDKINSWDQWLRPLLDDLFVIDAPAVFVRRNKGGGIYGLEIMDGATLKLLIDANGRRPLPPSPAFQQILKGVPAVSYTNDDLIYAPRNVSSHGPYGKSPVEMTMVTINAAINRAQFNASYYTEGNIPDAIGSLPQDWTPAQAAQFTEWWDSLYSGNLAQKRKVKFVPGIDHFTQLKEPELKNVYDDYIARILCCAMGISVQPFVSMMNRATAGTAKESSQEEGKLPVENWIKSIINKVIQSPVYFGYNDLQFDWNENEDPDPKEQMEILTGYVKNHILTPDQVRERLGEEPMGGVNAELGVITATGFVTDSMVEETRQQAADAAASMISDGGEKKDESPSVGSPGTGRQKSKTAEKSDGLKKNSTGWVKRPDVVAAYAHIVPLIKQILETAQKSAVIQVNVALGHIAKADDDIPDINIDLTGMNNLSTDLQPSLATVAGESGQLSLSEMGIRNDGITNQINRRAVTFSYERSAELVTMIDESTRTALRNTISQGLSNNIGRQAIIDEIASADYAEFSPARARLIADYEIANANGEGSLLGLKAAEDEGVKLKKEWYPDDEACPICQANADQGPIPLDEEFESGDDHSPAHPNCECSTLGVIDPE